MSDRVRARRRLALREQIYDLREENGRWSIHDTRRGAPVEIGGVKQVGLDLSEAEEISAILNRLEAQRVIGQAAREE